MINFQNILFNALETFQLLYLVKMMSKKSVTIGSMTLAAIAISFISNLLLITGMIDNEMLVKVFLVVSLFIVVVNLFKISIIDSLYLTLISTVAISLLELSILLIVNIMVSDLTEFVRGILTLISSLLVTVILTNNLELDFMYAFIKRRNTAFTYLFVNMFFGMACVVWYWNIDSQGLLENAIMFFMMIVMLVYLNFVVVKNGLINKYATRELAIYKTYEPVIDELIDEIRGKQHEYDNHIQTIKTMLTNHVKTDQDELVDEYLKDLKVKSGLGSLIKFQNKMLVGLIYSKKKKAEELGIGFELKLASYSILSKLKEYELVEILGTLLDNAMETNAEDNHIVLTIDKEKDVNIIKVMNRHPYLKQDLINKMFQKGFSTKSGNNRGYGLYNMRKIINRVDGIIEISNHMDMCNYVVLELRFQ